MLLDYKSERKVTKHSLAFYCFEKKSCFTLACDNQHEPPVVNYTPTTRQQEIQNSMFRKPIAGFFPDFLRAQNVVRVIEGKIIIENDLRRNEDWFKLAGVRVIEGSSY